MSKSKIAENPIELRLPTAEEHRCFAPDYTGPMLVSESAFPGKLSFYQAFANSAGELESGGWLGCTI